MYFYDLYIVDDSSESCMGASEASECLYPVPVLVRNFVEDNSRPNINQQTLDEFNDR